MIALHQMAGLSIRHKARRMAVWVVVVVLVAFLTAVSVVLGALGWVALCGFALWRLKAR